MWTKGTLHACFFFFTWRYYVYVGNLALLKLVLQASLYWFSNYVVASRSSHAGSNMPILNSFVQKFSKPTVSSLLKSTRPQFILKELSCETQQCWMSWKLDSQCKGCKSCGSVFQRRWRKVDYSVSLFLLTSSLSWFNKHSDSCSGRNVKKNMIYLIYFSKMIWFCTTQRSILFTFFHKWSIC